MVDATSLGALVLGPNGSSSDMTEAGTWQSFREFDSEFSDTKVRSWNRRWALMEKAARLGKSFPIDDLLFDGNEQKGKRKRQQETVKRHGSGKNEKRKGSDLGDTASLISSRLTNSNNENTLTSSLISGTGTVVASELEGSFVEMGLNQPQLPMPTNAMLSKTNTSNSVAHAIIKTTQNCQINDFACSGKLPTERKPGDVERFQNEQSHTTETCSKTNKALMTENVVGKKLNRKFAKNQKTAKCDKSTTGKYVQSEHQIPEVIINDSDGLNEKGNSIKCAVDLDSIQGISLDRREDVFDVQTMNNTCGKQKTKRSRRSAKRNITCTENSESFERNITNGPVKKVSRPSACEINNKELLLNSKTLREKNSGKRSPSVFRAELPILQQSNVLPSEQSPETEKTHNVRESPTSNVLDVKERKSRREMASQKHLQTGNDNSKSSLNNKNDLTGENNFQFVAVPEEKSGNKDEKVKRKKNKLKLSKQCNDGQVKMPKIVDEDILVMRIAERKRLKLLRKRLKAKLKRKKLAKEAMQLNADFQSIHFSPTDSSSVPQNNVLTPKSRKSKLQLQTESPNVHLSFSPVSNSQRSTNEISKEVGVILETLQASSPGETKTVDSPRSEMELFRPLDDVLKDVVACVQVRAIWEDRSEAVEDQLKLMGATISYSKKLKKGVTHLVFKDGQRGVFKRAFEKGLHIVSVQWVESCKQHHKRMPEHLFPVSLPESPPFSIFEKTKVKRFRSMQPKDLSAELDSSVDKVREIVKRTLSCRGNKTAHDNDELLTTELGRSQANDSPQKENVCANKKVKMPRLKKCVDHGSGHQMQDLTNTLSRDPLVSLPCEIKVSKELEEKQTKSIVLTSMPVSDQEAAYSIVAALGGYKISHSVNDSTTHLICGDKRRTLNLLMAMVRGCWILSPKWIYDSLEKGKWLEEDSYELCDFFPAVRSSRMEREKQGPIYRQNLFGEVGSMYISSSANPPPAKLQQLIEMAGGKVATSVRYSEVFVGPTINKVMWRKRLHHISEQEILDCISQNTVLKV